MLHGFENDEVSSYFHVNYVAGDGERDMKRAGSYDYITGAVNGHISMEKF